LVLLGLALSCGDTTTQGASESIATQRASIIAGNRCGPQQQPSAVALLLAYEEAGRRHVVLACSGVLLAPDVVATAAHCLEPHRSVQGIPLESARYWISRQETLTSQQLSSEAGLPADAVAATAFATHPGWERDREGATELGSLDDLGVVFLSATLAAPPAIVATAREAATLAGGVGVDIVGWGTSRVPSLLAPEEDAVGLRHCGSSFIEQLGPHEMQVGRCGVRKCSGDSGGPTYVSLVSETGRVTWRLVGLSSHSYGATGCLRGGVDTRLDAYRDWLDGLMREACASGKRTACGAPGLPAPADVDEPEGVAPARAGVSDAPEVTCEATGGTIRSVPPQPEAPPPSRGCSIGARPLSHPPNRRR
jgi:hypothetical protein